MLRKGFIFTLDAIFALLVVVAFIGIIAQAGTEDVSNYNLESYAKDSLTILEKDYTLRDSVQNMDNGTMMEYLFSLPENICGSIVLYDSNDTEILDVDSGCNRSTDVMKARRVFISDGDPYIATIGMWYR